MALSLRIASHSETGLVRKNNQDSGYTSPQLLAVADGMGARQPVTWRRRSRSTASAGSISRSPVNRCWRRCRAPSTGPTIGSPISSKPTCPWTGWAPQSRAPCSTAARSGWRTSVTAEAYLLRDGHLEQLTRP